MVGRFIKIPIFVCSAILFLSLLTTASATEVLLSKGTTLHFVPDESATPPQTRDELQFLSVAIVPAGIKMVTTGRTISIDGVKRLEVITERGIRGFLRENPKGEKFSKHYWTEKQFIWLFRQYNNILVINQTRKNLTVIDKTNSAKISPSEIYRYVRTDQNYFIARPKDQEAAKLKNLQATDKIRIPLDAAYLHFEKDNITTKTVWFGKNRYIAKLQKFKAISRYNVGKISKRCGATSVIATIGKNQYHWTLGGGISLSAASGFASGSGNLSAGLRKEVAIRATSVSSLPENLNVLRENYKSHQKKSPYEITRNQKCKKTEGRWESIDDKFYGLRDMNGTQIELDQSRIKQINRELSNKVSFTKENGRIFVRCMRDYLGLMKAMKKRGLSQKGSNLLLLYVTELRTYKNLSDCS